MERPRPAESREAFLVKKRSNRCSTASADIAEALLAKRTVPSSERYVLRVLEVSRPVVEHLARRFPLVLVSNFYGNIHTILRDFRLEYFQAVVESAVVGVRKPDPQIFRLGVEALGLPAEVDIFNEF